MVTVPYPFTDLVDKFPQSFSSLSNVVILFTQSLSLIWILWNTLVRTTVVISRVHCSRYSAESAFYRCIGNEEKDSDSGQCACYNIIKIEVLYSYNCDQQDWQLKLL